MFERIKLNPTEQINIESLLSQGVKRILRDISELSPEQKKDLEGALRSLLKESIDQVGEYFNEEQFIHILENQINNSDIDENLKQKILEQLITEKEGEKILNQNLKAAAEDIFRKSPEKKGINFRDKIEDPQELRGMLYLMTQNESFRGDFERLISQKEKFYFRLWPPKLWPFKAETKPGEFFQEVQSYIEDIQKGKDKITLWFEEDLLPDEFKTDGKPDEEKLKQAGVEKKDGHYEFYITPDKLKDMIDVWSGTYIEIARGEVEINKLLRETKELQKYLLKDAPPELEDTLRSIGNLIVGLEERYRDMIETGASKEELEKIKNGLEQCKKFLEDLKSDVEEYREAKDQRFLSRIRRKTSDFLSKNGSIILSSLGLWGLAIGWFLPLWMISKMYNEIDKFMSKT